MRGDAPAVCRAAGITSALFALCVACSEPAPVSSASVSPASPSTAPAAVSPREPPIPAFVVFTSDDGHEHTTVIPLDPSRDVRRETGYWILDPSVGGGAAVRSASPEGDALPACVCPDAPDGCSEGELVRRAYPAVGSSARCGCVHRSTDAECDDCPDAERVSGDHVDFSILGTTLVRVGELHEESELANNYYADVEALSLALAGGAGTFPIADPPDGAAFRYCVERDIGPDLRFTIPEVACMRSEGRWFPALSETAQEVEREDAWECRTCSGAFQATASILRGSRLLTFQWNFYGPTVIVWTAPTRTRCPSPADACGPREGFPTLAYGVRQPYDGHYWIATSGFAALVGVHGDVLLRGEAAPVRGAGALALGDALGVHFLADVGPILAGMDAFARESTAAATLAAAARCTSDADCLGLGSCDVACLDGACVRRDPSACDAEHACDPGLECSPDRRCVRVDVDRELVDTHGGRDWGARCVEHLRAGDLEAAQSACERGLAMATEDRVRGALLYNLGRCAEERGSSAEARDLYERSLVARPDSEATRARLTSLSDEGDAALGPE